MDSESEAGTVYDLPTAMDIATPLLAALEKGGTGAVIAGMLIWYLKARDGKANDIPAEAARHGFRNGRVERLENAIISIAEQAGRQTAILQHQTALLQECAAGHRDTQIALARLETKTDMRRPN